MAAVDAKKWADLFEVDLESALDDAGSADYDTTASERVLQSFEQKCLDMKVTMQPNSLKKDDLAVSPDVVNCSENALIAQAVADAKQSPPPKVIPEISGPKQESDELSDTDFDSLVDDVEKEVDADIAALNVSDEYVGGEHGECVSGVDPFDGERQLALHDQERWERQEAAKSSLVGPEPIQDEATEIPDKLMDDDNPLQFEGIDLIHYRELKSKCPQFVFYDGSRAFRDFYRHKFWSVWNALHEFPILPIREMNEELDRVNLRHFVGEDVINPDLVQKKLDQVYQYRVRIADLLIKVYHQYFFWERSLERLKAKLWKDHEIKGAHRRDALILEHLTDMDNYYQMLKGFVESAKHADSMLKAAADSLSRQLTCLQMKEQIAVPRHDAQAKPRVAYDAMDGISDGEIVHAPKAWGVLIPVEDGVTESDEIAELG